MTSSDAVKTVALFEALKGVLAFLVAAGALALVHRDLHEMAVRLVEHAHLNPAARYPGIFLEAAGHFQSTRIRLLALGAALYAAVRGIEAFGLYRGKAWAELLAAGSGAVYIPFELLELHRHGSWLSLGFLLANLAVVAVMVRALRLKRTAVRQVASRPAP